MSPARPSFERKNDSKIHQRNIRTRQAHHKASTIPSYRATKLATTNSRISIIEGLVSSPVS